MASRLSELNIKSELNRGDKSLPWDMPESGANLLKVDFDRLLASPQGIETLQSLPPQLVYHSLKLLDEETRAAVTNELSVDQFTRVLDYDVWTLDKLEQKQVFTWLMPLKKFGPVAIARRFVSLEEEYQLASLDQRIQIFDLEEYENLPAEEKDNLVGVPGGELYYRVLTDDAEIAEGIVNVIDSVIAYDLRYALSLLSHAAYVPPNEAEALLTQFRRARLEEDGFVTAEEGMEVFTPLKSLTGMNDSYEARDALLADSQNHRAFLDQVIIAALADGQWNDEDGLLFQQGSLYLANSLCSALGIEASDLEAANRLLEHAKGIISLALDHAANGDLQRALDVLKGNAPKQLFRYGITWLRKFQGEFLKLVAGSLDPQVYSTMERLWLTHKWGELQWLIDSELSTVFGLQFTEACKGLYNRFPMRPIFGEENGVGHIKFKIIDSYPAFLSMQRSMHELLKEAVSERKLDNHN